MRAVLCILAFIAVGIIVSHAAGQAPSLSPVGVSRAAYPIEVKAGEYELIVQVADLPPGSGVPLHVHPGPVVATVITGEVTLVESDSERVVKARQGWQEIPDSPNALFNRSSGYARVVAAYLIPKGAAQITFIKK
ncbi:MAG TPA: cupin domain-containing protein [bacterium]|nr:cupin domain-containing protein [bacterium]